MSETHRRETVWARARKDTEEFRGSFRWWLVEVLGAVAFAVAGYSQVPKDPSNLALIVYPATGVAFGFLGTYLMLFLWNLIWAAARQRNEAWGDLDEKIAEMEAPKPPRLPRNRDDLVKAVTVVERAAKAVIVGWQRNKIATGKLGDPNFYAFQQACDELELQTRIAEPEFRGKVQFFSGSAQLTVLEVAAPRGIVDDATSIRIVQELTESAKPVLTMLDEGV